MFNKVWHSRPSSNEGEGPGDRPGSSGTGSRSDGGALLALVTVSTLPKYYFWAGLRPRSARHWPGSRRPRTRIRTPGTLLGNGGGSKELEAHKEAAIWARAPPHTYFFNSGGCALLMMSTLRAQRSLQTDFELSLTRQRQARGFASDVTDPLTNWWSVAFPLYLAILRESLRLSISPKLPVV